MKSLRRNLAALSILNILVAIVAGFGLGLGEFSSLAIRNAKKFNEFAAVLKSQQPERTTDILMSDLHVSHIFSMPLAKLIEKTLVFCIVLAVLNAVMLTIIWVQSRNLVTRTASENHNRAERH